MQKKLDKVKLYVSKLANASKWNNSKDTIISIQQSKSVKKKAEYIYEFYCLINILVDLKFNYKIEIKNNGVINYFPKSPGSKKRFPYFSVLDKKSGKELFQVCAGTEIVGLANETSAPDISFQAKGTSLNPIFKDVIMVFDSKYKHKLGRKVSKSEYNSVHGFVTNLGLQDAEKRGSFILFKRYQKFIGNCLITNGEASNSNKKHHELFKVKEVENFDEGVLFNVIG